MSVTYQIIQASDLEEIIHFEQKILEVEIPDEMERTIFSWNCRWRKESLNHYLPMGWSFVARNEVQQIVGYFLAQPLLFFDGKTQTLWVEYIQSIDDSVRDELMEIAYKLSREKHFQRVLFPENLQLPKSEKWEPGVKSAWTTKISGASR